jgi:signal transduction histidine kinase
LKQVLVNLIDNGIKYNVQGGALSVEVSEAADQALIVVSDTGIGITPEDQQFIFDRFYRVSTDRGESGAGLGLAIVKSICHAHGGSVAVTSGIDGGSLFFVELPLWTARASI